MTFFWLSCRSLTSSDPGEPAEGFGPGILSASVLAPTVAEEAICFQVPVCNNACVIPEFVNLLMSYWVLENFCLLALRAF